MRPRALDQANRIAWIWLLSMAWQKYGPCSCQSCHLGMLLLLRDSAELRAHVARPQLATGEERAS